MSKGIKKITTKTLGYTKPVAQELAIANKKESFIPLFHLVGGCFKATVEESESADMKDYLKLAGTFKAVDVNTGEETTSNIAILPEVASNMIASSLLQKGENGYAEVSMTIGIQYDEKSATSYVWGCESHNDDESAFDKLLALIPDTKSKTKKLAK